MALVTSGPMPSPGMRTMVCFAMRQPRSRRCSTIRQRSCTTGMPASSRRLATASLRMPDWSQTSPGRSARISSAWSADLCAATEDVEDVDGLGNLSQRGPHRLPPEHPACVDRIGGKDPIALAMQVVRDVVRGLPGIDVRAQHGDAAGPSEKCAQLVVGLHRTLKAYWIARTAASGPRVCPRARLSSDAAPAACPARARR